MVRKYNISSLLALHQAKVRKYTLFLSTIELTKSLTYGILIEVERMGIMNKKEALTLLDCVFKEYYWDLQRGKIGERLFQNGSIVLNFTVLNARKEADLVINRPLLHYQPNEAKAVLATMLRVANYLNNRGFSEMIVGIEYIYFPLDEKGKWYGCVGIHPC